MVLPVQAKIRAKVKRIKHAKRVKKWNLETLKIQEKMKQFKQETDKIFQSYKMQSERNNDMNTDWEQFKQCIEEVAKEICGDKQPEKKKPWMTVEILDKMKLRKQVKGSNDNESKKLY